MANTSWYWILVQLKSSSGSVKKPQASTRLFFQQRFPEFAAAEDLDNKENRNLQAELMGMMADESIESDLRLEAERCLRCYISHQILYECVGLEAKFGQDHGFTCDELLGFVLNDLDLSRSIFRLEKDDDFSNKKIFLPFAAEIIDGFKPENSSLSTWAGRLTRQQKELNEFLLEHGILHQSDWSLLNEREPESLRNILSQTFNFSVSDSDEACRLLASYHEIYRPSRRGDRGRCPNPTEEQLMKIREHCGLPLSTKALLAKLMELADYLRQYRLICKGVLPSTSMDDPEFGLQIEAAISLGAEAEDDGDPALTQQLYELVNTCLDQAIETAIRQNLNQLSATKAQQYILALKMYCCDQLPMTQIALKLGFSAQSQVTRLLRMDDFCATVRRQLIKHMKDRLLSLIQQEEGIHGSFTAEQLQNLDENKLATIIAKPRIGSQAGEFFRQHLCHVIQKF